MSSIEHAINFAQFAHDGQIRKFSKLPYFLHLQSVANMVQYYSGYEDDIISSYLHDALEDTDTTLDIIEKEFGPSVAYTVKNLTSVGKNFGTRAERKVADNIILSKANYAVQTIKCADILDNVSSMLACDPEFGKKYLLEKIETVSMFKKADPALLDITINFLNNLKKVHGV